jgi:hypothetical protein
MRCLEVSPLKPPTFPDGDVVQQAPDCHALLTPFETRAAQRSLPLFDTCGYWTLGLSEQPSVLIAAENPTQEGRRRSSHGTR